jgi:hypothetical protein
MVEIQIDMWYNSIIETHNFIKSENQFNNVIQDIYFLANEYEYKILKAICIKDKVIMKKNILNIVNNLKNSAKKFQNHALVYNELDNQNKMLISVIQNKFILIRDTYIHYYEEKIFEDNFKIKNI